MPFRRLFTWKIRSRDIALGDRTLVMGVLNVTPDSFSDGGNFLDPDRAYARAMQMEEEGADLIDIGAESTRPGAQPVTAAEELQRLVPVLKRLRDKLSIPISVDTYKAEVAERALELGVEIINDPSGFTFDPQLSKPLVQFNAAVILNHMRGRPETWASLGPMPDVMSTIVKDLDASVNRARRAGVDRARIVVDPGIGFGKRREQNSEILARLPEMARLELPILVGPSRKSFLAQPEERETEFATAAAVSAAVIAGAHLVRVHDVKAMKVVATVADEIWRAQRRVAEAREPAKVELPARRTRPAPQTPQVEATAVNPPVRPPLIQKFKPAAKVREPLANERPASEGNGLPARPAKPEFEKRPAASARPQPERPSFRPRDSGPPRPSGDRASGDRPGGDRSKFQGSRPPRPREDRPRGDRPRGDRPRGDRPRENRPRFEGSRPPRPFDKRPGDKRSGDVRPQNNRPQNNRTGDNRPRDKRFSGPRTDGPKRFTPGGKGQRKGPRPGPRPR